MQPGAPTSLASCRVLLPGAPTLPLGAPTLPLFADTEGALASIYSYAAMACVGFLRTPCCTDFHGLIALSSGSEVSMGQWLQRLWESHSPHPEVIVILCLQFVFLVSRGCSVAQRPLYSDHCFWRRPLWLSLLSPMKKTLRVTLSLPRSQ